MFTCDAIWIIFHGLDKLLTSNLGLDDNTDDVHENLEDIIYNDHEV
jgi:hypothetical protein